tara:strand:+ start:1114 stop:1395 length:282 start_codon:yes stop_codon:yes gene_type:complete
MDLFSSSFRFGRDLFADTAAYTNTGLQLFGKAAWVFSASFVVLVLPLRHSLLAQEQFEKEQEMQREQMKSNQFSTMGLDPRMADLVTTRPSYF